MAALLFRCVQPPRRAARERLAKLLLVAHLAFVAYLLLDEGMVVALVLLGPLTVAGLAVGVLLEFKELVRWVAAVVIAALVIGIALSELDRHGSSSMHPVPGCSGCFVLID